MKKNNINNITGRVAIALSLVLTIFVIVYMIGSPNPQKFQTIFPVIGFGVFAILAITSISTEIIKLQRAKKLKQEGRCIEATIQMIEEHHNKNSSSSGHRYTYVIYCTYTDEWTNITYRFRSYALHTNPRIYYREGSNINVYVDPEDYSKYYVEAKI